MVCDVNTTTCSLYKNILHLALSIFNFNTKSYDFDVQFFTEYGLITCSSFRSHNHSRSRSRSRNYSCK